jgi:hypothetical protein
MTSTNAKVTGKMALMIFFFADLLQKHDLSFKNEQEN